LKFYNEKNGNKKQNKRHFFSKQTTFQQKKTCFRTTAHWAHSTLIAGLALVRAFVFNDARCLNTAEATGLQNNAEREEKSRELRELMRQKKSVWCWVTKQRWKETKQKMQCSCY